MDGWVNRAGETQGSLSGMLLVSVWSYDEAISGISVSVIKAEASL